MAANRACEACGAWPGEPCFADCESHRGHHRHPAAPEPLAAHHDDTPRAPRQVVPLIKPVQLTIPTT